MQAIRAYHRCVKEKNHQLRFQNVDDDTIYCYQLLRLTDIADLMTVYQGQIS